MDRDQLVLGLAAVFAGLTMLLVVLGFTYQLFLLVVAVPFAATTYFMWYQASGRLAERTRSRRVRAGGNGRFDGADAPGFGAGPRGANGRFGGDPRGRRRRGVAGSQPSTGPTPEEAYRALGLDADASQEEVKRAYRRKVKEVHPDTESGDEESFKRVNRAYERLSADSPDSR